MAQKYLEEYPADLTFVQDSRLAEAEIRRLRPNLVLSDYEMPHMSGPELCKLIKGNPETKDIAFFIFTATSATESINISFNAGADDYINKPICKPELISRLDRCFQNIDLRNQLRIKVEEQVALVRVLTHDLGNYTTIIDGASNSLDKLKFLPESEEKGKREIGRIRRTVGRVIELTKNIRSLSAIEDQKLKLDLQPQPLGPLLEAALGDFQNRFEEKNLKVTQLSSINQELMSCPVIFERVSALNSVIGNIISNAIKFSHRGGSLDINLKEAGAYLVLEVRDHGMGMSPSLLAKVFSKTEKTNRIGTENEPGTGFGMPLVKLFMECYGGKIEITSKEKTDSDPASGTSVMLFFKKA